MIFLWQELVDMTNEVEKKGEIYFKVRRSPISCHHFSIHFSSHLTWQDFCMLVLRKFREEDEEEFIKVMFKVVKIGGDGNVC